MENTVSVRQSLERKPAQFPKTLNIGMNIFLANPWGLLGLLAVPAIVAIHFLHSKPRRAVISTLFLLERISPPMQGGRRLRHLRHSLLLWLQIALAVLASLLLAEPRIARSDSLQKIVLVLDDSASMEAFRSAVPEALRKTLKSITKPVARSVFHLIDSRGNALYQGESMEALIQALESWRPRSGEHDTGTAFRIARAAAGADGVVLFLTDHAPLDQNSADVAWVSIGSSLENTGFTSGEVTAPGKWRAMLRNYGTQPAQRTLRITTGDAEIDSRSINLDPGEAVTIQGEFPPNVERLNLALEPDAFPLDDQLPLQLPQPKILTVAAQAQHPLFAKLITSLAHVQETSDAPALTFAFYSPLSPGVLPSGAGILFVKDPAAGKQPLTGALLHENHPLTEGLNWGALAVGDSLRMPLRETDEVLLWQGSQPLIFLRRRGEGDLLVFNFDPDSSNITRLPAFPVMVHRFAERLRAVQDAPEAGNFETRQEIRNSAGLFVGKAPDEPRFFEIVPPGKTHPLSGAAQFADWRESDFRQSAPYDGTPDFLPRQIQTHSRNADWTPWLLAIGILLIASWSAAARER